MGHSLENQQFTPKPGLEPETSVLLSQRHKEIQVKVLLRRPLSVLCANKRRIAKPKILTALLCGVS